MRTLPICKKIPHMSLKKVSLISFILIGPFPLYGLMKHLSKHVDDNVPVVFNYNTDLSFDFTLYGCTKPMRWYTYYPECLSLMADPLFDFRLTVDPSKSKVIMLSDASDLKIGDSVRLRIDLYDGYGRRRDFGGDDIRVRMYDPSIDASSVGHVTDHRNGSYSVHMLALWSGRSRISVMLFYPREAVRSLYHVRRQLTGTRAVLAKFQSEKAEAVTPCHPFPVIPGFKAVCNLTNENGGMSWYCGKPNDNNLLCHDWVETKLRTPHTKLPLTDAEKRLLTKDAIGRRISDEIAIYVSKEHNETLQCKEWTFSSLWDQTSPTGFFIKKKWNSLVCINEMNKDLHMKCMNGTRLYLLGDSTLRQWYTELKDVLECEPNSEAWTTEKWHKPASCFNSELDFGMQWLPHAFPFFTGSTYELRRYKRPIKVYIDEIDSETKAIIVIHLYAHFLSYHPDVFQDRFKSVVVSARNLLTRNPHAIILIKGPHSFRGAGGEYDRLNDFFAYVYKEIMLEEIGDLRERVIYLDTRDMTIAEDNPEIHPNMEIVREMVKLMLSFVCWK